MTHEAYAVSLGDRAEEFAEAAAATGLPQAGIFILATYAAQIRNGEAGENSDMRTASEHLQLLADQIEAEGVSHDRRKEVADQIRYLAQFAVERPIPTV